MSSVTMYEVRKMEEQKKNTTIWNRAYKQGGNDALDRVLEIIGGYKSKAPEQTTLSVEQTTLSIYKYNMLLDQMKRDILALKGGDDK